MQEDANAFLQPIPPQPNAAFPLTPLTSAAARKFDAFKNAVRPRLKGKKRLQAATQPSRVSPRLEGTNPGFSFDDPDAAAKAASKGKSTEKFIRKFKQ